MRSRYSCCCADLVFSVQLQDIELPDIKSVPKEETLVRESAKLRNFWKASTYYLEDTVSKSEVIQYPFFVFCLVSHQITEGIKSLKLVGIMGKGPY